jgi:hypothetical protein
MRKEKGAILTSPRLNFAEGTFSMLDLKSEVGRLLLSMLLAPLFR